MASLKLSNSADACCSRLRYAAGAWEGHAARARDDELERLACSLGGWRSVERVTPQDKSSAQPKAPQLAARRPAKAQPARLQAGARLPGLCEAHDTD